VKPGATRTIGVLALGVLLLACHRAPEPADDLARAPTPLAPLIAFEESARKVPPRTNVLGADPFRSVRVGKERHVGLLRRAGTLVLLDERMHELARVEGPPSATGLATFSSDVIVTSSELAGKLWFHRVADRTLTPLGTLALDGVKSLRAVASGSGSRLYALDAAGERVLELEIQLRPELRSETKRELTICRGAFDLDVRDELLRVPCLFDHALGLLPLGEGKPAKIVHDGPIWSSDVVKRAEDWLVVVGGVEDHPLDRTIGSFGFVDSFVFLYRWRPGSAPSRLASINVSEHGVITPKVVSIRAGDPLVVDVLGYGGENRAVISFEADPSKHAIRSQHFVPGSSSAERQPDGSLLVADPLLDAWISLRLDGSHELADVGPRPEDAVARLGEALFFTELMAKTPKADGPISRFSCETCHFEGGVDGRVHHTGRGNVRATTKPLFGLLQNRPYFSRALDPTMSEMVHAEFRVANKGSGADPWFALDVASHPFVRRLGIEDEHVEPMELRRALVHFLASFPHLPNPATLGRARYSPDEARGAAVFRDRCESCHSARAFSDEPASRVDFPGWEAAVFEGRLVWASADYHKTGIEPYVHEKGARVPSLRRLARKRPYFTNGSARTLEDVLSRVRFAQNETWHEATRAPADAKQLDPSERKALLSFLDLL
jgi:hypothetical protein